MAIDPMKLSDVKACSKPQGANIDRLLNLISVYDAELALAWREDMRTSYRREDFSMRAASIAISHLEATVEEMRKGAEASIVLNVDPCAVDAGVLVPKGYYAVATEKGATNALAFYRVTVSEDERVRWVAHQVSGTFQSLPKAQAESVLWKIVEDPREAKLAYGRELGFCGECGRPLTNDESRAYGMGPICRSK